MAITITPYTCTCEKKRINKGPYLTAGTSFSNGVKMEANQDIKNPNFLMKSSTEPSFNYCYINVFNRYYYVVDKDWIDGDVWRIYCTVDPLYSFKDKIYNLTGVASRLEDQGGYSMIIDDRITTEHTQPEDISFYELSVANGKKGFNIQDADADYNLTFSCFAGKQQATVGLNTLTLKTGGGSTITLAPTFNRLVYYYNAASTTASDVKVSYTGTSGVQLVTLINETSHRTASSSGSSGTTGTVALAEGSNVLKVDVSLGGTSHDTYTIYIEKTTPTPST